VLNTDIKWNEHELIDELNQHPERFSPNVMLRGLFQETILPNVAFIGGGAEVAYWLQLKTLFSHYKTFYPSIHLRQSVLWVGRLQARQRMQLACSLADIFKPGAILIREYVTRHTNNEWQTNGAATAMEIILADLKERATTIDPTLTASAEAALAKMRRQLAVLEQKMLRAEKKKMATQVARIMKLKEALFPHNSLQERVENFMEYYLEYGPDFLNIIKNGIEPLQPQLLIVEMNC